MKVINGQVIDISLLLLYYTVLFLLDYSHQFNLGQLLKVLYALTLSSLNLPLSSSSTTSRELLSQFSACSG